MNQDKQSIYIFFFLFIIGFALIINRSTGASSDITEDEIMEHIRYLSHPNREGRYPGSRGSKDAISYIIKKLKSFGVQPGFQGSFTQSFDIKTGIALGKDNFFFLNSDTLSVGKDYIPISFSSNKYLEAEVVFAGYGFNIAEENLTWNDYQNLDVKNKWVIVMRNNPDRGNQHSIYYSHSSLHKKMLVARDAGAAGVVFISQIEDEGLFPFEYIPRYDNVGIPIIHLSNTTADRLLKTYNWSRKTIQEKMNNSQTSIAFEMDGTFIEAGVDITPVSSRAANIIGLIRSGNRKHRDEHIVIGAHFDHIGMGGEGSGSRKPSEKLLHPGADDNSSGTAGLLELAQKLSANKNKLKRSVLLVAFDAEEKGLLGSKHFIQNAPVDLNDIIAMVNMDMIGRMEDSTATVGGVGTSTMFESLLDSLMDKRPFNLIMNKPGFGPSDHASFYAEDIPVLFFFSGFHDDYHTPADTWKLINLNGEKHILDLIYDTVYHLARLKNRPVFAEAGPKQPQAITPARFRITFGIMPSYTSEKIGLEIDAISKTDGPAAKAGIKKGDVIKSINGKTIKNIYEYMERLSELRSGQTIPVIIDRNGKNLELSVSF